MESYPPPPPYTEQDIKPASQNASGRFQVRRKPVATQSKGIKGYVDQYGAPTEIQEGQLAEDMKGINFEASTPTLPSRPHLQLRTSGPTKITDGEIYASPQRTDTDISNFSSAAGSSTSNSIAPSSASTATSQSSSLTASSAFQKAYREARHFAGGLIQHPHEGTKHFSILRHSHGLVFYQGTATTLAISIFSDAPLPQDRTIWLQSKGWSGKTGMRARAFIGRNGNWLNVTPSTAVVTEQLNQNDERAWQRDIGHFRKRVDRKIRDSHLLRETAVVRIPVEAGDGYFQLVLCRGDKEKVLCPSPVFRVISTSSSLSSVRGASLSTLPFEIGAMVLSGHVKNTIGNVLSPVTSTILNQVQPYMPSTKDREAASVAYNVSGTSERVNSTVSNANSQYSQARDQSYMTAAGDDNVQDGPRQPYPIRFSARGEVSQNEDQFNIPSTTLLGIPENVSLQLRGYYFGWVRLGLHKRDPSTPIIPNENPWVQAVISAIPPNAAELARANITHANRKIIKLYLVNEFDALLFDRISFDIQVLGFIRADTHVPLLQSNEKRKEIEIMQEQSEEQEMIALVNDMNFAQAILDQPAWGPEPPKAEEKKKIVERATSGYADVRLKAQRQIDKVPLHKIGVRMQVDRIKENAVVANGFYIIR